MNFITNYPSNSSIFRSAHTMDKLKEGKWFSFVPNVTFGYGTLTGEFKTNKDLKLIDICREDFYNEFINYLHAYNVSDSDKCFYTFALGFVNFECYKNYAKSIGINVNDNISDEIERMSQFFGNRSRCSVHQLDQKFVDILYIFFKDHADGFIAKSPLPNKLMNGKHHPELYLFNNTDVTFTQTLPQSGGTISNELKDIIYPIQLDISKMEPKLREAYLNSDVKKYDKSPTQIGGNRRKTLRKQRHFERNTNSNKKNHRTL
jgi:hypothetical protein